MSVHFEICCVAAKPIAVRARLRVNSETCCVGACGLSHERKRRGRQSGQSRARPRPPGARFAWARIFRATSAKLTFAAAMTSPACCTAAWARQPTHRHSRHGPGRQLSSPAPARACLEARGRHSRHGPGRQLSSPEPARTCCPARHRHSRHGPGRQLSSPEPARPFPPARHPQFRHAPGRQLPSPAPSGTRNLARHRHSRHGPGRQPAVKPRTSRNFLS